MTSGGFDLTQVPPHPAIVNALLPDEDVLWAGRPFQGLRFYLADFGAAFFVVVVLAIALGSRSLGAVFAFGVALVAVPFWLAYAISWDRTRRAQVFYALTSQRALILEVGTESGVRAISLKTLKYLSHTTKPDGSGSIAFGKWWPETESTFRDGGFGRRFGTPAFTFEQIPEVDKVYYLASDTRSKLQVPRASARPSN